jgi:hypothetical protein
MSGFVLSCTKALHLAQFPLNSLDNEYCSFQLSLPLSKSLSSHDTDHLGLQRLSRAVFETHMALSDEVELGFVAIIVDELCFGGNLQVMIVI